MNHESIYILHLSDLHIRNEGKRKAYYSNALKKLIEDINEQTKHLTNLVLVISGDIIDQGDYATHAAAAKLFFEDLNKKIKDRVYDIIVVPGNHDKHRDPINTLISIAHIKNGLNKDSSSAEVEWKKQLEAYQEYFDLQNSIRKIFGKEDLYTDTFGVQIANIGEYNICFLRIDSAWCSYSANDYRKLRVDKYQLSRLNRDYSDIKNQYDQDNKKIDLTIAISHYPLNWLNSEEEDLCNNYFLSDRFLDVDVLMCGHVHDFSAINHFNHEHSLLTLVTGIGWQAEKPEEQRNIHRYSIYTFNLAYNSCDIIMRKTKSNGDFDYDYSVYVGARELEDNKLRYPLKVKESASFIRINTMMASNTQGLYVNESILSLIPEISNSIASFSNRISSLFDRYKDNFLSCFMEEQYTDDWFDTVDGVDDAQTLIYNKISDYLYEDKELTQEEKDTYLFVTDSFRDFLAFLYDICVYTVDELKESFSDSVFLRAHFRWHNHIEKGTKTSQDTYQMLCQYSNHPDVQKDSKMQDVPWGGFIKAAFETEEPIVFSANKKNNIIQTSWDDFITLIPFFNNSVHDIRIKRGINEHRPIISLGISLKGDICDKDSLLLLLLAYLRFDKVIGRMIDYYIQLFNIDARSFIKNVQSILNNDNKEENINE